MARPTLEAKNWRPDPRGTKTVLFSELSTDERIEVADVAEPTPDVPWAEACVFGAYPGWSPEREENHGFHYHDAETGRRRFVCRVCGGDNGPIGLRSRLVCGACFRSGYDDRISTILHEFPAPPHGEPGPWEDESKPKRQSGLRIMPRTLSDRIAARKKAAV